MGVSVCLSAEGHNPGSGGRGEGLKYRLLREGKRERERERERDGGRRRAKREKEREDKI